MEIGREDVEDLLCAHLEDLRRPGVLSVRPGYELTNGWLTGRRAIVVTVAKKRQCCVECLCAGSALMML